MANGLPEGFTLDQATQKPQGLPQGFTLDAPQIEVAPTTEGQLQQFEAGQITSSNLSDEEVDQIRKLRINKIPELTGSFKNLSKNLNFIDAVAGLSTFNPDEFGRILSSSDPAIGITTTPEGERIAVNNETGAAFSINKLGPSFMDAVQIGGTVAAFTPASRGATIIGQGVKEGFKTAAKLGVKAGATQTALETTQAAAGGEFNPKDVALSAAIAPVGQAAVEKVVSPIARAIGGKVSESAKELFKSAKERGVDILTTDILPPNTFAAKTIQQLGEKLGFLGTGGKRAAQQKSRVEIVEGLAQELGVTLDQPIEASIFQNLKTGVAKQLDKAAGLRQEAVDSLDTFGTVDVTKAIEAIDRQIAKQNRLRGDASQEIIERLESLKASLPDADFSLVKDLRSNLIDDITAAFKGETLPTKASAPLQAVKSSIDDVLLNFGRANDRQAAAKWVQSNKLFSDGYRKAKDTEIKRLLSKGDGTPEVIANILKGGKTSELKRLSGLIGKEGNKNAQLSIIRDALTESGFFTKGANPTTFLNALSKPTRQKAINVFFKGADKKQIEGIKRILDATRRAQEAPVSTATGQQLLAPVAVAAGAAVDAGVAFGAGGTLAAIARTYESAGMRNLLLRLGSTPKGSKAEQEILKKVTPFFNAAAQVGRSEISGEQ